MPINHAKTMANHSLIGMVISISIFITGNLLFDFCRYIFSLFILSGIILTFIFLLKFISLYIQANQFDRMINSVRFIAHWIYDPSVMVNDYKKKIKGGIPTIILLTFIYSIIGGSMYYFFGNLIISNILFCFLIILFTFGYFIPKFKYKQMIVSTPEVYIGVQGAWIMDRFIQWNTHLVRIQRVYFNRSYTNTEITVEYIYYQRTGWLRNTCKIPVPQGKEQEAEHVAISIASANRVEYCPMGMH